MISEETKRKLRLMKVGEMIPNLERQEQMQECLSMSFDERFQMIVDNAYQEQRNADTSKKLKNARLRFPNANIHDIYYPPRRKLDKNLILSLATGSYIRCNNSVIIQGYSSTGKTYIGCALGRCACEQGYSALYIRYPDLLLAFDEVMEKRKGLSNLLNKYSGCKVLILDEWMVCDASAEQVNFLFELCERRYDKTATIFCTLYPLDDWVSRLGGGAQAESLAERYHFNNYTIETGEMNMREIYEKRQDLKEDSAGDENAASASQKG